MSRGEIFSLLLPLAPLLYLPSLFATLSFSLPPAHTEKKPLKHSFIGRKKKEGITYAGHMELSYYEKLLKFIP